MKLDQWKGRLSIATVRLPTVEGDSSSTVCGADWLYPRPPTTFIAAVGGVGR